MKVLGFMTIFYSGDYLRESLLSVRDYVDKMVVAYTNKPSHGHSSNIPCPDKRENILAICKEVLQDKLIWDEAPSYSHEGAHRDVKYKYSPGYGVILTVDCDEIMLHIPQAIQYALNNPERFFGISGYINFFRSFSWYTTDGFRPIRIEVVGRTNTEQNLECPMTILHFSCAQRREVMEFKYKNFGHASEVRPNYLEEVFYKWTPESNVEWLHAVSLQIWRDAQYFDKSTMPWYLKEHPYYKLEIIP